MITGFLGNFYEFYSLDPERKKRRKALKNSNKYQNFSQILFKIIMGFLGNFFKFYSFDTERKNQETP